MITDSSTLVLMFWILVTAIAGCIGYYYIARKKAFVDIPNERSSHTHQPVRGMGIAILPTLIPLFFWYPSDFLILLGIAIATITGYLDDRYNLRAFVRLPLYLGALLLATYNILWGTGQLEISWWYALLMIIVALGLINTYNFMDGINGITAMYSMVFFITTLSLYIFTGDEEYMQYPGLVSTLLFFILVFAVFNFRGKALAFLGDSGSVSLGLLVSAVLISLAVGLNQWQVVIMVAVYGVDSVGTIIMRLIRRENIFEAHRSHLYQDLVHVKSWSHLSVAFLYALVQLLINIICFKSIVTGTLSAITVILILGILTLIYLLSKKLLNQLNFKRISND